MMPNSNANRNAKSLRNARACQLFSIKSPTRFHEDPFFERAQIVSWTKNLAVAENFMAKIDPSRRLLAQPEFPADRLFWARSAVLKPLFDLRLDLAHYLEQTNTHGSISHVIAGLLPAVCEISNHTWATVYLA